MPVYLHSYVAPAPSEPQLLVLTRSAALFRAIAIGCIGLGAALGLAASQAEVPDARLGLSVCSVAASITAVVMLVLSRSDRVVFDRSARTLTLADGTQLAFSDIQQMVVLISHDSDDGDAYALAVETPRGRFELARTWCWNERRVRDAAEAIVRAFPDLPFATDPRRED